jgi:hypothetical protein
MKRNQKENKEIPEERLRNICSVEIDFCGKNHRFRSRAYVKHHNPLCRKCPFLSCRDDHQRQNFGFDNIASGFCETFVRWAKEEIRFDEALDDKRIEALTFRKKRNRQ